MTPTPQGFYTVEHACRLLHLTPDELSRQLRREASDRLELLAEEIEEGALTREAFDVVLDDVWRLVESADACDYFAKRGER